MSEFIEEEDAPCWSLSVLLCPRAMALWLVGLLSHRSHPAGHSQSQLINTLVRKHIGSAAGREDLVVRSVAKLKITFISPSCHGPQKEGSAQAGRVCANGKLQPSDTLTILTMKKKNDQTAKYFIFEIIKIEVFSLFAPMWVRWWP